MAKGGSDSAQLPAASAVPQTNALQHLMSMFAPQTFGKGGASGPVDQFGVAGGAAVNDPSQIPQGAQSSPAMPSGGGMPIADPNAWIKAGTGNFTPGSTSKGGLSGGGSGGDASSMMSFLKMLGGG